MGAHNCIGGRVIVRLSAEHGNTDVLLAKTLTRVLASGSTDVKEKFRELRGTNEIRGGEDALHEKVAGVFLPSNLFVCLLLWIFYRCSTPHAVLF
jgi:hypothetical protein